jgi:hypothetical protein
MKQKRNSSEDLVAPCGMYCALCSGYLAMKNDVKRNGVRMSYCHGCRPRGKTCAFLKKKCPHLLNHTVQFCYECSDFPCDPLKHLDTRYRTLFRTSFIENLRCIQQQGMNHFLDDQKKKWRCPTCGDLRSCHNGLCFHCQIDVLQKKKKRYRWDDE